MMSALCGSSLDYMSFNIRRIALTATLRLATVTLTIEETPLRIREGDKTTLTGTEVQRIPVFQKR